MDTAATTGERSMIDGMMKLPTWGSSTTGVVGRGNDQMCAVQVVVLVSLGNELDRFALAKRQQFRAGLGRDGPDLASRAQQQGRLSGGDIAGADDDAELIADFQKDWQMLHS